MNELKDWAPMSGSNTRAVHEITIDDLEEVNVPFSQYGITEGEELHFDKNAKFAKQDPAEGSTFPSYRMTCLRNGRKSYFDPGFLMRQNINRDYVYPEWAELGSAAAICRKLIEMGTIKGGKSFKVDMRQRRGGVVVTEAIRKEDGTLDLNPDGTPKMKELSISRDYPTLPNPKA